MLSLPKHEVRNIWLRNIGTRRGLRQYARAR
jgi:hypothetical protein